MSKTHPDSVAEAVRRAAGVLLFASLTVPLAAQVGTPEASRVAVQQRTMDHYEALLGRLVAAGQRGDCSEFRSIHDLELTDFDAEVRAAGLTPEWRRDYEKRVDAAVRDVCSQPAGFAQRQMMNRYETVLARMIAAVQREDCSAFRDIRDLELTDFDADARLVGVSPEWRSDYERRVDAAAREACAPPSNAGPSSPSPAEKPQNARFDSQLEILRDAQAAGACGPYQTFQSVLVAEIPSLSSDDRRRLAEVLARGCSPAAGSPWNSVAPVAMAPDLASASSQPPAPQAPSASTPKEQGLNWLIGTWRIPGGGGEVAFRLEPDGTASGYFVGVSPALAEAGYYAGQVFLRGCRDSPQGESSIWRYAADCSEGFRDTWQGAGVITIEVGEEEIELPTYIGSPIAGYQTLARISPAPPIPPANLATTAAASPKLPPVDSRRRSSLCEGFAGTWQLNDGKSVTLTEVRGTIRGTYRSGEGEGRMLGRRDGRSFIGRYEDAVGAGTVQLFLNNDDSGLAGPFNRTSGAGPLRGNWSGRCVGNAVSQSAPGDPDETAVVLLDWNRTVDQLRPEEINRVLRCPSTAPENGPRPLGHDVNGRAHWGVYGDARYGRNSRICAAAVHAGFATFEGGTFRIEAPREVAGSSSYDLIPGSEWNGISSDETRNLDTFTFSKIR